MDITDRLDNPQEIESNECFAVSEPVDHAFEKLCFGNSYGDVGR
jgi:hypothetical protein